MTTPRPRGSPPTTSGCVFSSGASSSSTDAKNASRSRCATIGAVTPQRYGARETVALGNGFRADRLHVEPEPEERERAETVGDANDDPPARRHGVLRDDRAALPELDAARERPANELERVGACSAVRLELTAERAPAPGWEDEALRRERQHGAVVVEARHRGRGRAV